MASKILIVEDEPTLREALKYNLQREGYKVLTAADGLRAVKLARTERPHLIVLDIMLPGLDGFEVCRIVRKDMTVPILILTAKDEEVDKILGLELGADDYMTKPFSMRELKARVKAVLRRSAMVQAEGPEEPGETIILGDLSIDAARRRVTVSGREVTLAPKEFDLLLYLSRSPGRVFTREELLDRVWGYEWAGGTRTVDVHIRWLREKLEPDPSHPARIVTVRGVGYKIEV